MSSHIQVLARKKAREIQGKIKVWTLVRKILLCQWYMLMYCYMYIHVHVPINNMYCVHVTLDVWFQWYYRYRYKYSNLTVWLIITLEQSWPTGLVINGCSVGFVRLAFFSGECHILMVKYCYVERTLSKNRLIKFHHTVQ